MNLSDEEIKHIFLTDDIFPLGKYETVDVTCEKSGLADAYPCVLKIYDDIDYKTLLSEAYNHMDQIGFTYVKSRLNMINPNISEDTLKDVLGHVGFVKGSYQSFSLRKLGTNQLESWVLSATRNFFNSLPVRTFRQQYAVAYPGWNVKLHRDHADFRTHGFRAMVPLSADVYMGYETPTGENLVFRLERGSMYFVNIAMMHRGFNESLTADRINLIFQMDSDFLVNTGHSIEPLPAEELKQLPSYAVSYEKWKFGYEL